MSLFSIGILLLLGCFGGLMAGLLGVGGGMVLVPFLTSLFSTFHNLPQQYIVHISIATAMATIMFTSLSSMRAHHLRGGVRWDIFIKFVPGILIGGLLSGGVIFKMIDIGWLALVFAIFVSYSGFNMFRKKSEEVSTRALPPAYVIALVGVGIGLISGIVGAGGGFLTVPLLVWCSVPMRNAVGTSAACGFPIAVSNVIGYIYGGMSEIGVQNGLVGFVYWPALLALISMSVIFAPIGAKLAHSLPVNTLRKVFAVLLFFLALLMLKRSLLEFGLI
ncbi:sulfite exporter TauE/SafE family protein [Taylorella equigenitalis]|uniref:sulfite exporter TauE/SafE family protein n=1 Tax=Taylorella equigenitalis TaxID=29575 RepID=UPI0003FA3816|nr:sulfite exporter TauE/SafE family protein [Taylorella equigenitalis]ASY29845.1 anion permease [Taylorella equigenitalis]ASY40138.1 anion permease [Taylorella equigenitalis]KOS58893.1 hypothetical protein AM589_03010 [Taylorella equigenitalis]